MRVLMLSWEYPPHLVGGLGKHVCELVPALAGHGVEIHLVTPMRRGGSELESVGSAIVHRVSSPVGTFPDFYSEAQETNQILEDACEELIGDHGHFDLIHNHDWLTSFAAIALKRKYKLPLLTTIHATERGRGQGHLRGGQASRIDDVEWQLTYEAWRVICCTRFMAGEVHRYFGIPLDKVDIIPNGVDPSSFQALEGSDLSGFRAGWAGPEEKIVLHVGRIVVEKGVEVLVRCAPQVLASVPETKFIIAGKGPELKRLRGLVKQMNLSRQVAMPGFIDDDVRDRLYKVADCAVFPSLYEPFGIVALEAMAARVPVVVSEVGGLPEVVRHAETGITVYPNNPGSCAWGIIHTLRHPKWAQQRVENACQEVLTIYNWDTIARQTVEVYARVIAERARTDW